MTKVLFLCVHNSARSQMAEAYLNKIAGDRFTAESAGLEPGKLNPFVAKALAEDGIDITGKESRSVFDLFKAGKKYQIVVTVCDKEAAERCPIFPGLSEKLHWPFPDPSRFTGSDEEIMARTREVRDMIRKAVGEFAASRPS
jgi:arsenate reductase